MSEFQVTELDERVEFGIAILDDDALGNSNSGCKNSPKCCGEDNWGCGNSGDCQCTACS